MGDAAAVDNGIKLRNIAVTTNGSDTATATVTLEIEGQTVTDAACANGPVNAIFSAIDRLTGNTAVLEDYTLKSVTRGSEALGDATVKLRHSDGCLVVGKGISTDILEASARAYVNALTKHVPKKVQLDPVAK